LSKRTGPPTPSKRPQEVEARLIRTRFETHGQMDESADTVPQRGSTVSARRGGQVLADYGLSKKKRLTPPARLGCGPKQRAQSSTAPGRPLPASSPATTSSLTSQPCANAGAPPPVRVALSSFPPFGPWAPVTSAPLEVLSRPQDARKSAVPSGSSLRQLSALPLACAPSIRSAALPAASSRACLVFPPSPPSTGSGSLSPSRAPWHARPHWANAWSPAGTSHPVIPSTSMPTP
jgi:hypothetical protein